MTDQQTSRTNPVRHIVKEGSRQHVVWWTGGIGVRAKTHCSERRCEINRPEREGGE